jgi:hypothetical protein
VVFAFAGSFNQFVDDVRRSRLVGIAHPEIDNILSALSRF